MSKFVFVYHGGSASLISAASIDAAVALAQGCPLINDGGTVEVAEAFDM